MEFTAKAVRTTPREVWLTRADWQADRDKGVDSWSNGLSDVERAAVLKFVRIGMEQLYDSVEEWIPHGLQITVGETLEVTFKIFFTEVRDDIDRSAIASSFRIREAINGNERMVEELQGLHDSGG